MTELKILKLDDRNRITLPREFASGGVVELIVRGDKAVLIPSENEREAYRKAEGAGR